MSTESIIGILYPNNVVEYITCQHDGYLNYVGLFLNTAYRTPERVKSLVALGDIRSLGLHIAPQAPLNCFDKMDVSDIHLYCLRHLKASFVESYIRDWGEDVQENKTKKCKMATFKNMTVSTYVYLYNWQEHKWYAAYDLRKNDSMFAIDTLLKDKNKYKQYTDIVRGEDRHNVLLARAQDLAAELRATNNDVCSAYNAWLQARQIYDLEFTYGRNTAGKSVYKLMYKVKPGEKRRRTFESNACIGVLVLQVIRKYGIRYL